MKSERITATILLSGLGLLAFVWQALALVEPEVLFDVKTDKKIEQINIVGENGEYIMVFNDDRIFVHDGQSGKKLWEDEVPGYTDDGLDLIWNKQYYITSMKKGMRAYDIATGKVVWETATEVKMKTFREHVNFKTNFILFFKKEMQSFDPNTGEIHWRNEEFDLSETLEEAGLANIYQISRPYGDRLLLLGDKQAMLYDGKSGKLLGTTPVKWDGGLVKMHEKGDVVPEPIAYTGDNMVTLFCKEHTTGLDLRTGATAWTVDEAVDRRGGYLTFEQSGKHYALFGFKKKSMFLNLDEGKIMWETGEDMAMEPIFVNLQNDGTLFYLGLKKSFSSRMQPWNVFGTMMVAYGLDFQTGKPKWGPTPMLHTPAAGASLFGFNPQFLAYEGPYEHSDGLLFFLFGQDTRLPEGDFKTKGGEGFVLIDPKTGQIKWRNEGLTLYDNWIKVVPGVGGVPNYYKSNGYVPEPIFEGKTAAYVSANNTVVKVDLTNGKTIWQGPEYSFVYRFTVDNGRVFGPIGHGWWTYKADAKKQSAKDDIHKSKKLGYFVVDASNGKEVFSIQKAKIPLTLHFHQYDPKTQRVYLSDGEFLRGLNLASGKYDWELNLDKQLNGPIGAKQGVIFKVSNVETSSSYAFYGGGSYSISTSTVTTYDISMEHRIEWLDGKMVVLAKEGPAMVGADGKVIWKGEWDWKTSKINFSPRIIGNGIVYQYKKKLTYLSLKDGSIIWQTKEKGDSDFAFDEHGTKIFVIEKKALAAYKL